MKSAGHRFEPLSLISAAVTLGTAGFYVWLIRMQGDQPVPWVLAGLLAGALLTAYGAVSRAPCRRPALLAAAVVLVTVGVVGILSIGLPVICSGLLAAASLARAPRSATRRWKRQPPQEEPCKPRPM